MSANLTHKVRCRVGGLLVRKQSLLLIHIHLPTREETVWMPPGGEVEFGESLSQALKREFQEETGLQIEPRKLAYINEFIEPPYHAVEHYFSCEKVGGALKKGEDPEYESEEQIIEKVAYHKLDLMSELNLEPAFLKDRLYSDWHSDRMDKPQLIPASGPS